MSQIDEAFIQAYATPLPKNAPLASSLQRAGTHQSPSQSQSPSTSLPTPNLPPPNLPPPHIQLHQALPQQTQTAPPVWASEPVPAPHFHVPSPDQSTAQTTYVAPLHQTAEAVAPVEPASERRPLSTFSAPEQPATTAFSPVFEVDAFRWPKITTELLTAHHSLLIPVIEQLLDVSEQGRSLIGIAGTRNNVGCSTLLMCLARLLANAGKSVALVDANFAKASLAQDLGLGFDTGWENVLAGELPLAECVIKSLQDNIALLPLVKPTHSADKLLASIQTSVTAGVLRYHYDLVLFNLGAADQAPQDLAANSIMQYCRLDAGIIIADTERTGIDPLDTLLSLFGNTCLGVIGNSAAA